MMRCRQPRHAEEVTPDDAFVELENVTLTYGRGDKQVQALTATNLRIEQGDFVALVGPSGCGKSTILKLVTGLLQATNGYVYVAGREVGAEPMRVGMAFQNPTLLPWLKHPRQRDAAAQDRAAVPAGIPGEAQDRVSRPRRCAA